MEIIGSLLFLLAVVLIVVVFIARPFLRKEALQPNLPQDVEDEREHQRSSLLADRDRILTALQDLDFDFVLGKVPQDDYPEQRAVLLQAGADVLRKLDQMQPEALSTTVAEDRIEAAVAARRADARLKEAGASPLTGVAAGNGNGRGEKDTGAKDSGAKKDAGAEKDALEEVIAARKRQRKETAGGFCPKCGRPVSKSDKFCSKCGTTL
jgi:hypothetical protein